MEIPSQPSRAEESHSAGTLCPACQTWDHLYRLTALPPSPPCVLSTPKGEQWSKSLMLCFYKGLLRHREGKVHCQQQERTSRVRTVSPPHIPVLPRTIDSSPPHPQCREPHCLSYVMLLQQFKYSRSKVKAKPNSSLPIHSLTHQTCMIAHGQSHQAWC